MDYSGLVREMEGSIARARINDDFCQSKCIFKIPNILIRHDEAAYIPNAFSIGPLHYGKPDLQHGDEIKITYLGQLIERQQVTLESLIQAIERIETQARRFYAVPIDLSQPEFVKILVIDGCFIIELLRKAACEVPKSINDRVFSESYMLQHLHHDLLLLENQIPWPVLVCLFNLTTCRNKKPLVEIAIQFYHTIFPSVILPIPADRNQNGKHLLDLLRIVLIYPEGTRTDFDERCRVIPSATDLLEAGIEIKKAHSGPTSSGLDISFIKGVLEIPPLVIREAVGDAVRNIISYEQCYPRCTAKMTSYVIFLDNLIRTTKDLDILRQKGIIGQWFKSNEDIKFFNKLYVDTHVRDFYYLKVCEDVSAYCQCLWPRWRAIYVRHFTNPWAIVSQVVGGIFVGGFILVLTFLQTFYTMEKR